MNKLIIEQLASEFKRIINIYQEGSGVLIY